MSGLVLVAASGLAREVLPIVRATGWYHRILVVDDNAELWGSALDGSPIIGGVEQVMRHPDDAVVVCAGRGETRRNLVRRLSELGVHEGRYTNVVHAGVDVPCGVRLGRGCIVLAQVALTAALRVGDHVVLMPNVTLTHDDVVDDYATLCAGVSLGGGVAVGAGAYLGMNASVREGVRIGPGSVLGMGAALVADLPPGQVWAGVPAVRRDKVPAVRRDKVPAVRRDKVRRVS